MGNLGSALAGRVVAALIGVVTFGVLARSIGADGLGDYRTVLTLLLFAGVVFDFGLYSITLREISHVGELASGILGNAVALRIVATICAVLVLLLVLFLAGYDPQVRRGVMAAGAGWVGYQVNDLLRGVFQLKLAKHKGAIAETVGALVGLAGIGGLAALGCGSTAMLCATAFGLICTALLAYHYANRLLPFKLRLEWPVWRTLMVTGIPVAGSVLLLNVQLRADVLLLWLFQGPRQVGLYDAPLKLYELLFVIPYLFGGMMMPFFVRDLGPDGGGSLGPRLGAAIAASVIVSSMGFAVVYVHAGSVITLLAGPGFDSSATPLRILAAAALFAGVSAIMRFATTAMNVPQKMFRVDLIGVAAALAAHCLLIPTYGIVGAAIGKLCGNVVTSIGALMILRKQFTSAIFNSGLVAVAAGIALCGALTLADFNGLPWLIAVAMCLPATAAALYLVPHVRQELRSLAA